MGSNMLSRRKLVVMVGGAVAIAILSFLLGLALNGTDRWVGPLITAIVSTGLGFALLMYFIRGQSRRPK